MSDNDNYINNLIALHTGLTRQGPGDETLARALLHALTPRLPPQPRIADLGCGSGAGALLLAQWFATEVIAVDFAPSFVQQLVHQAQQRGLAHLIHTQVADFGQLDWAPECLDLLWSEGAAYVLGFAQALRCWRPLLTPGGIAVISELNWFCPNPPTQIHEYWHTVYPEIGDETCNCRRAQEAGFEVIATSRLSTQAWWDSYYTPLNAAIARMRPHANTSMQAVIAETEQEIALFKQFSEFYGYTFYVLAALPPQNQKG
jgi:SAM-dependent methyltransferase